MGSLRCPVCGGHSAYHRDPDFCSLTALCVVVTVPITEILTSLTALCVVVTVPITETPTSVPSLPCVWWPQCLSQRPPLLFPHCPLCGGQCLSQRPPLLFPHCPVCGDHNAYHRDPHSFCSLWIAIPILDYSSEIKVNQHLPTHFQQLQQTNKNKHTSVHTHTHTHTHTQTHAHAHAHTQTH